MDDQVLFGELLQRFRIAAGLTQEELAERASLSARAISDLERGVKTRPHPATVRQLAQALQLTAEQRAELVARRGRPARQPRIPAADGVRQVRVATHGAFRPSDLPVGGFLGALPEGTLVAREGELERIVLLAEESLRGAGRIVLLAGEPGVGKTRLAQEASVALRQRDFLVATGRCYDSHQMMPLYPMQAVFSALYALAPPFVRSSALDRWPYLRPLLPDELPSVVSPQSGDQHALFRAAAGFARAIAESSPVAILLDDLHWSDTASLDLLLHLAREARGDRIFILGAYRDAEVNRKHRLTRVYLDLERERLVERIPIRPLEQAGTSALVGVSLGETTVSPEFAELIYRRTEGNPFFVQQVIRMLVERGDLYRRMGTWMQREIDDIEVPEGVRALIGQRLTLLRDETQEVLHEASVLGQTFHFDVLQAMTRRPEDELEAALEDAWSAALARTAGIDAYAFDHALTQQTLYAALSPRRKRKLHLAAGEALERLSERERDERVVELAWHFLEGGNHMRAIEYALRAGNRAEKLFAHAEAEQQYRVALQLAKENGDEPHEAEAEEKLGRVLAAIGRYDDALGDLERAVVLYQTAARVEGEARALAAIGGVHADRATSQEAIERLRRFLRTRGERVPELARVSLLISLARLHFVAGEYVEAAEASEQASLLARAAGDKQMFVQAERLRLGALSKLGSWYDQKDAYEELQSAAEGVGDLYTLCQVLNLLGDLYHIHLDKDRSTYFRSRAVEIAERLGDPTQISFLVSKLGQNAYEIGDWSRAGALLERGLEIARSSGAAWAEPYALFGLGLLHVATGDWNQASIVLEEGIATCVRNGDLQAHRHVAWPAADKFLLEGRPDLVPILLEPILDRAGLEEVDVSLLLPALAQAYLDMGDSAQAGATAVEAVRRARVVKYSDALMDALRVQAAVLSRKGCWEAAMECLEEALSTARKIKNPYVEGRVLYELGQTHARKGESGLAQERLGQGFAIFQRLGAKPYIERTEGAFAALRAN